MSASPTRADRSADATRRAVAATALFALAGIVTVLRGVSEWAVSAPLALSYAILVANTYCSLQCFGRIIPPGLGDQRVIDGLLVAIYLALAANLADTVRFAATATVLFAVATMKYAALMGRIGSIELLARKVRVDTAGTLAAVLALVAALGGHDRLAGWLLLALSIAANVYLLLWRPLYRAREYTTPDAAAPSRHDPARGKCERSATIR